MSRHRSGGYRWHRDCRVESAGCRAVGSALRSDRDVRGWPYSALNSWLSATVSNTRGRLGLVAPRADRRRVAVGLDVNLWACAVRLSCGALGPWRRHIVSTASTSVLAAPPYRPLLFSKAASDGHGRSARAGGRWSPVCASVLAPCGEDSLFNNPNTRPARASRSDTDPGRPLAARSAPTRLDGIDPTRGGLVSDHPRTALWSLTHPSGPTCSAPRRGHGHDGELTDRPRRLSARPGHCTITVLCRDDDHVNELRAASSTLARLTKETSSRGEVALLAWYRDVHDYNDLTLPRSPVLLST